MEAWESPDARIDTLVLTRSREEVEAGDIAHAAAMLDKLLNPSTATRAKGKLILAITGYDDDPRDLWEIPEVRAWMQALNRQFPFWFYFMDLGPRSTLGMIAFCLCHWEKVPGGKLIPPEDLQRFLATHFAAMNRLGAALGDDQAETDARSREIGRFFLPQ